MKDEKTPEGHGIMLQLLLLPWCPWPSWPQTCTGLDLVTGSLLRVENMIPSLDPQRGQKDPREQSWSIFSPPLIFYQMAHHASDCTGRLASEEVRNWYLWQISVLNDCQLCKVSAIMCFTDEETVTEKFRYLCKPPNLSVSVKIQTRSCWSGKYSISFFLTCKNKFDSPWV